MATALQDRLEIGSRIRELRRARGLKIQELADLAGLSAGHLSEVERGQSTLSGEKLRGIARALGCSTDYLLTGEQLARQNPDTFNVPAALSEAAIDLKLSHRTTMSLLRGRQSLVASRRRGEGEEWSKAKWISFYQQVKDYLDRDTQGDG